MLPADLHLPLDELLRALAADGLRPGMLVHLRLRRYLEALARRAEPPSVEVLKYQLGALLCQSPEEQVRFYEGFEKFIQPFARLEQAARANDETSLPSPADLSVPPLPGPVDRPPPTVDQPATPTKTSGRSGPVRIELTFPVQYFRAWNTVEIDHAVRPLREKEWTDVQEWDIPGSIRETIRAGGIPHFTTRRRKKAPQYLLLIEQESPRDHLAGLYTDLVSELQRRDLDAAFYYYTSVPYRCWRDPRDPQTYTNIESLQSEYAGYKLLLVGNVDGLLDLPDLRPTNLAFDLHDSWREVALLCPKSTAEWGEAERALCPLFPIVPANAAGLSTLVQQWSATEVFTPRYWQAAYPEPALPLPSSDGANEGGLENTLEGLYYYLGEQGFQWLCAAAVYPELYWELTKLLHDESIPPDRNLSEGDQNRQWQVALLRLSRVGWFRQGHLPTPVRAYLRQYFEGQMSPEQRQAIRSQLLAVLGMAENQPPPGSYAAADRAFTIAWYEYERALAAPHLNAAERARIEAEFREKGLAKIALTDIEDAIGRKLFEELQADPVWPGPPDDARFHVLWVDDEPKNNVSFQNTLHKLMRAFFLNARSTKEALEQLAGHGFDLIVSDVSRQRRDDEGTKMLTAFREKGIATPVIFFTTPQLVEKRSGELRELGAAAVFSSKQAVQDYLRAKAMEKQQRRRSASSADLPPKNLVQTESQQATTPLPPNAPGFQVLWVDDEPKNNARFQDELNELMQTIFTNVTSTDEALTTLAGRTFDLIISDVSRHGRDDEGAKMLRAFREKGIATPVVFYTTTRLVGKYSGELRELGAAGVFDYKKGLQKFVGEQVMAKQQGQNDLFSNPPFDGVAQGQQQSFPPPPDTRITAAEEAQKVGDKAMENKNYEAATAAYQQALNLFTELKDDTGRANTHQALGKLYVATNDLESALQHFKSASTLYLLLNFNPAYAYGLMDIGGVQRKMGLLADAQKSYEEALEILEELGDEENLVEVRRALNEIIKNLSQITNATVTRIKEDVERLIANDETGAALDVLAQVSHEAAEVANLKARYDIITRQFPTGEIDLKDWRMEQNRINHAVLEMANSLDDNPDKTVYATDQPSEQQGLILYHLPNTMQVNGKVRCTVRIAATAEVLQKNWRSDPVDLQETIQMTDTMSVELEQAAENESDEWAFDIERVSPSKQKISRSGSGYAQWVFDVESKHVGIYILMLNITLFGQDGQGGKRQSTVVLEKEMIVTDKRQANKRAQMQKRK